MEFLNDYFKNYLHKFAARIGDIIDRLVTYFASAGLIGWSSMAKQVEPILSVIGILVGIGTCVWRVWRDIKKERADADGKK